MNKVAQEITDKYWESVGISVIDTIQCLGCPVEVIMKYPLKPLDGGKYNGMKISYPITTKRSNASLELKENIFCKKIVIPNIKIPEGWEICVWDGATSYFGTVEHFVVPIIHKDKKFVREIGIDDFQKQLDKLNGTTLSFTFKDKIIDIN